jgi:hypothetical protein
MIVPSNFSELLAPGLRKIYGLEYAQYPEEFSQVFEVTTTARAWEEDMNLTGFGLVPPKPVGRSVEYDTAYQGWKKRYTMSTFGLGFIVAREMLEDDLYRQINNMPKALSRSVRHTIEVTAANHLNRAFNSSYVGADSKQLCATDHPLIGGGTFRNMLSVSADLDITSFEQALIDISTSFYDDRGLLMAVRPLALVVHPSNDFQCQYILKSERLPDTANNNYNPARGILPRGHLLLHWLTDPDAWFILTDVPNGLLWFWRRNPEFTNDNVFDSENAKFKTTYRCDSGWTDPRCIFGSPGA